MSNQYMKNRQEDETTSVNNFREKFEALSANPATRVVNLIASSCCGCGCSDIEIRRIVPFNSTLKDGDRVKEIERSDEIL